MNGLPATGAIGFGKSGSALRRRVPSPPARTTATVRSDIAVLAVTDDAKALDQFANAAFERPCGSVSGCEDAGVRDDVIPFIRILTDRRFKINKARQLFPDLGAELELREVRFFESDVVGLSAHRLKLGESVLKGARHIPDVDEVALEMPFKNDDRPIVNRAINEI